MDKRKKYIIVADTETCNGIVEDDKLNLDYSLVYDIGWSIVDKKGNIYKTRSFLIREIFILEKELMTSAYYAEKIPKYWEDVKAGTRKIDSFYNIRKTFLEDMKEYNVNTVSAHNARFDLKALNNTQRWLTKSEYRYFFPYGTVIWDTLKMARQTFGKQKMYKAWCKKNDFMTKNNQPRFTAEILYRYITGNLEFEESHTGLEDVLIETKILSECLKKHMKMVKVLYA